MTRTQMQYYSTIREFVAKYKYFPTFSEISKAMGGKSSGVVHKAVHILIDLGYIVKAGSRFELVPAKMHGLQSCDQGHQVVWFMQARCPVCEVLQRFQSHLSSTGVVVQNTEGLKSLPSTERG